MPEMSDLCYLRKSRMSQQKREKENQTGACDGKMHSCNINEFTYEVSQFTALFIPL